MPRCKGKVDISFIEKAGARAARYGKRSRGILKMASQLNTLCGVRVALVCAPTAGAGAPLVWESEEGVLESYRAAATVPPKTRAQAQQTHRTYLEAEMGKQRAKLARARPGALPDWDAALNDMTREEALEVLEIVDAKLRAAGDRMTALGLPADRRLETEQVAAPDDDASVALHMDMDYAGFQTQTMTMPCHGGSNDNGDLLEQFLMQPECGFEGGSSYAGAVDETQALGGYGYNADCSWLNLTMCNAADESWNAAQPVGHYPYLGDGALARDHYYSQDVTCRNYADTLQLQNPMGMGMDDNFTYLDMDNSSYAPHRQAKEFQCSDTGTGQYQYQTSDPGEHSSGKAIPARHVL